PEQDARDIVSKTLGLGNQLQFVGFDATDDLRPQKLYVVRVEQVMPAAAEAEHQKAVDVAAILARKVFVDLIDLRLVDLHFAATVDDIFLVGFLEVGSHPNFAAFALEINLALLRLVLVDDFLVLVPHHIRLEGSEVSGGSIHPIENAFKPSNGRQGIR